MSAWPVKVRQPCKELSIMATCIIDAATTYHVMRFHKEKPSQWFPEGLLQHTAGHMGWLNRDEISNNWNSLPLKEMEWNLAGTELADRTLLWPHFSIRKGFVWSQDGVVYTALPQNTTSCLRNDIGLQWWVKRRQCNEEIPKAGKSLTSSFVNIWDAEAKARLWFLASPNASEPLAGSQHRLNGCSCYWCFCHQQLTKQTIEKCIIQGTVSILRCYTIWL